jgi:hypothetical protein
MKIRPSPPKGPKPQFRPPPPLIPRIPHQADHPHSPAPELAERGVAAGQAGNLPPRGAVADA